MDTFLCYMIYKYIILINSLSYLQTFVTNNYSTPILMPKRKILLNLHDSNFDAK